MKVLVGCGDKKDFYVHDNISKVIVKFEPLERVQLFHGNTNTLTEYNVSQYREFTFEIVEEKANEHNNYDADFIRYKYHLDDSPKMYKEREVFKPIF